MIGAEVEAVVTGLVMFWIRICWDTEETLTAIMTWFWEEVHGVSTELIVQRGLSEMVASWGTVTRR